MSTSDLERTASAMGANAFGVTSTTPFDRARATLERHRATGLSGPLHFTYDDPVVATDVTRSFPWALRIVAFGYDYLSRSYQPAPAGPVIARFATADHYETLRRIAAAVSRELTDAGARAETLIDDNRMVDRVPATRAGLGWLGRSTMLLAPGHGPWLLVGSVITDAALEETKPTKRTCGTCVDCMPACPTGAITDDGLDANLCISTWLQTPGALPLWVRPLIERRIYGCDDCLTSCPPGLPAMNRVGIRPHQLSFAELLALDDDRLIGTFPWFYIPHRQARFLRRNLLVAAGNSEEPDATAPILAHFTHGSSLVRGHAYWALARSRGVDAWGRLRDRLGSETAPDARAELEQALLMLRIPTGG